MVMKRILVIGVVFCLFCTVALAQDNPVPSVGTVGGSVLGTNNEAVPYIFGNGTSMYVKAQVDLSSIGLRRPLADLGIVFDTDGSFFLNTILSGGATNSGITKFSSTGAVLWTNKMPNGGGGGIAGTEPIVGGDYLYSQTLNSATNAVYALNKSTGATAWGVNLDSAVNMTPTLSDGYLYGVESNNEAFAINASTGAVAYQQAVAGISTQSYSRPIFIANAFGSGQNGMFWQGGSATYGMSISHTGASSVWSQPYSPQGYWSYSNVYDPVANQIYRNATNDAGVEGIDPQTGNVLWTWSSGSQGYDNGKRRTDQRCA
jgi:outer membrane protein assembly factor BamB